MLGDKEKPRKDTITRTSECRKDISGVKLAKKRSNMRNTPEIRFIMDQSIEYGVNMSKLIDEVTQYDNEHPC